MCGACRANGRTERMNPRHTRWVCEECYADEPLWVDGDAYTLPEGWSWSDVVSSRPAPGTVPLAEAAGIVAWGVFRPYNAAA